MNLLKIICETYKRTKLPPFDMELILAYVLKKSREYIIAHPETKITNTQEARCQRLIRQRLKGLPIAYITGHKEFYGLDFIVNKNVLVPRPETELMVEEALARIAHSAQPVTIFDVGTGSGCIIVTMARLIKNCELKIKNYKFIGIDISRSAISTAKKNAKLNNVEKNIKFLHGNLLEPILKNKKFLILNSKFLILANLPYLTPTQITNSPTIQHEPKLALAAGADGLKYYRQLFKQIKLLDAKYNIQNTIYLLCEIDPSQKNKIASLLKKQFPKSSFEIKKDLKNHSRLAIININRR